MDLSDLLATSDLILGFDPVDKWDAIERLVDRMIENGHLASDAAESVREAVTGRERSMSTGMERGIAMPHAAVDGIEQVVACMGIVTREEGLEFESIDGQPARLVVLLVIPRSQKLLHIRTLADLARILGTESVREVLLSTKDPEKAWGALCGAQA